MTTLDHVKTALQDGQRQHLAGPQLEQHVKLRSGFYEMREGTWQAAVAIMRQIVWPITRPGTWRNT